MRRVRGIDTRALSGAIWALYVCRDGCPAGEPAEVEPTSRQTIAS
ncbi:hypothetical protein [Streptodolium elevatio]|uniref:Uncharacterized protein n=1 Tax=Streptodolium elevatio TaxID=3157996 RepID=A0ABV3D879_9ACTN